MSNYLSSGRAMADWHMEQATSHHEYARWCFRNGFIGTGKDWIRQAMREWRNYRRTRGKMQ